MQAELTFDGVAYIVTVRCVGGDTLEVVVEHKADASTWAAAFAAKCGWLACVDGKRPAWQVQPAFML